MVRGGAAACSRSPPGPERAGARGTIALVHARAGGPPRPRQRRRFPAGRDARAVGGAHRPRLSAGHRPHGGRRRPRGVQRPVRAGARPLRRLLPSGLVPASALLHGQPAGFDPLAHLLRRAHARGLQVHAWVNVLLWRPPGLPLATCCAAPGLGDAAAPPRAARWPAARARWATQAERSRVYLSPSVAGVGPPPRGGGARAGARLRRGRPAPRLHPLSRARLRLLRGRAGRVHALPAARRRFLPAPPRRAAVLGAVPARHRDAPWSAACRARRARSGPASSSPRPWWRTRRGRCTRSSRTGRPGSRADWSTPSARWPTAPTWTSSGGRWPPSWRVGAARGACGPASAPTAFRSPA